VNIKTFSIKGLPLLYLLAGLTTFSLTSLSFAIEPIRTINGTVSIVSDGHTLQVSTPEQTQLRVRLYGIDSPEPEKYDQETGRVTKPCQPYAKESRKTLESKIMGRKVRLDIIRISLRNRSVGIIWLGNRNINLEMVQDGYAEAYVERLSEPYLSQFVQAQKEAKSAKKGIWSIWDYERPSDFRKRLKIE